jgi:nicotinamidase-related amidase
VAIALDAQRTALLVMDLQNDIIHEDGKGAGAGFARMVKESGILDRTAALMYACRRAGLPVIHVVVQFREGYPEIGRTTRMFGGIRKAGSLKEGSWGAEIHAAVRPLPGEPVVPKRGVSSFHGTDLDNILRVRGATDLILTGVATNFVVEGTARHAADMGYRVLIARDCCASGSIEQHNFALDQILPMLATITTSEEIIAALPPGA